MNCKQCGRELLKLNGDGEAYCPLCMAKRKRPCPEIDPETGEWEGVW